MARQDEAEATIRILGEDLVTEKAKKAEKSVEKVGDKADEVAKGPLGRMKASMDALGATMLFTEMNQGAEFASKAIELLSAGWEQLKQAASERAVSNSFATAFGAGADAIERLQAATGGMIADGALQQLGAQGARAGLSIEQVAKLLDSSTRAAMASGKDVAETAQVFLKSTIESNDEATKQNGVLVSLEIAQREYARSIGTTADQLTKAQMPTTRVTQRFEMRSHASMFESVLVMTPKSGVPNATTSFALATPTAWVVSGSVTFIFRCRKEQSG